MNLFPVKKILILVAILALPGFLYYLLQEKGKNRYRPLEIYGPKKVAVTFHTFHGKKIPDTIYHHVADFSLKNSNDVAVSFLSDTSAIRVVSFFYPHNRNSATVNAAMDKIASEFHKNKRLYLFSISPYPMVQDKPLLQALASKFKAAEKKWSFLTGPDSLIHTIAAKNFFVDVIADTNSSDSYITSEMLILTDPSGRIRGYYDATDPVRVSVLSDEIKVLITEELRKIKGAN